MAVYYATKAFVLSFTEALAEELAGTGLTVTAVVSRSHPHQLRRGSGRPVQADHGAGFPCRLPP